MNKNSYLKVILVFAIAGMLFSGYLTFGEFGGVSCPAAGSRILGVPTCLYGFIMYLIVGVLSILGLRAKK